MRKKAPPVLGIDLSFRGPAALVIPGSWDMADWGALDVWDGLPEEKGEPVYARMHRIACAIAALAYRHKVKHVFIEGYAHGLASRAHGSVLMELGGIVKELFWRELGIELSPIYSSSARKVLLGKLPKLPRGGLKVFVQTEVYRMGAPKHWTDNAVDAFCVANAGRGELGLPVLTVGD